MPSSQLDFIAPKGCRKCQRLADFIDSHRKKHSEWYNGPVPSFGSIDAPILILGLAPGLRGANATGRPFTGDFAGKVLYEALLKIELASGRYGAHTDDSLRLNHIRITNAVRCVPPQNKPVASEIAMCRPYLSDELAMMKEGCLTWYGLFPNIARPAGVSISWFDRDGEEYNGAFTELSARIILHEYDHLNGYTFFDRAKPYHMNQARKKRKIYMRKLKKKR